ncbi:ATP synthase protein [Lentibacillus sp. JNUCC-1]|uniref:ATP synthase subunit I n=1 Tax=Lentibacillus sp. JNUCC-1 TaxID=2654513 RepID=UPI0012E93DE1|nr:ATP synthase subunit I [Lentibacillus sp. JNUCC-1]MUV37389.1 ATP synthase protein [Lentibacillus sp. JNUCC-1]
MSNYEEMSNRQRKWMLYLMALFVLGWGFTSYTSIFAGLLLGGAVSFYNMFLLQKKVAEFTGAIVSKTKTRGIGTLSRFAAAAFAIIIAIRFEEHVNLIAVVIGLVTSYIVIMADMIVFRNKD